MIDIGADCFRDLKDGTINDFAFVPILGPEDEVAFAKAVAINLLSDFRGDPEETTARFGGVHGDRDVMVLRRIR